MFSQDWDELLFISGYEEIWGRSKAELEGNPTDFLNATHPDDTAYVKEEMGRLSDGEAIDIEYRLLNEGETKWVWVKGEPIFDDSGNVVRVVGFTRDITERRQRERRYQTLVENLPGIVYRAEVAPDWPMLFIQGECEMLTGYTADELTDAVDFGSDLIHPDDQDAVFEMIEGAVDRGESFELTYRILTKDGETRWVWERGREIDDGIIEGFLTDITARVTHKQDLELRNQAINEAPIGVVMTDPHQEANPLVYVNRKFLEMTGYSRKEVLGRNCRFLQGPDTRTEPVRKMREAVDAREPITVELRNYRKDGSMYWNRVSIAPVRDDGGELVNFIGFQEDVTERKQRQEQLKVLSRVLRHNLRNNQNAIRSWAEVLREEADAELVEYAQRIIDSSYQLMTIAEKERIITEILTEQPRNQCVKLDLVLSQAKLEISEEFPRATCTVDCPDGTTIQATARFEEAIEELLRNAILHNDSSTPEVAVTVTETQDTIEVSVADNGPPIPEMEYPEMLSKKEESPVYHHGGLGLWLVNLVVSRSGATMDIEENEPRGNLVRITFTR
jgi:PAS domain S-box-containing protein